MQKNVNVAVVNAKRVRDFAKASGKLAKTDSIDASVILAFAKAFNPIPQSISTPDEKEQRLQLLKSTISTCPYDYNGETAFRAFAKRVTSS